MNPQISPSLFARRCCRALRWALVASLAIVVLGRISPANAAGLTITPNYSVVTADLTALHGTTIASDVTHGAAIEAAINSAIAVYEAKFSTPINVNITFGEMTTGLGESATYTVDVPYGGSFGYRQALINHATSANDATANASLPNTTNEPVTGGPNVTLTTANARAVGYSVSIPGGYDSTILLNTSLLSYPGGPALPGHYDLNSVVSHEIDEALATGSALNGSDTGAIRAEDLFRYSAAGVRSYSASAPSAYFSIDGGVHNLASFNQSGVGDFGDWTIGTPPRVQDWAGTPGLSVSLGPAEFTALDVLGYNFAQQVPEPGSLVLFGVGAIGLFAAARRRKG